MLTNTLNKTKSELKKLKSSGSGGGRGTSGDKGGREAGRSNSGGGGRGSGGGCQSQEDCAWMLVKITNTVKHPTKGYDMKWCKLCGPGCSKGTPHGMYINVPHDHKQRLLMKQEKQAQFEAKIKNPKPNKTKAEDEIKTTTKSNKKGVSQTK